MMVPPQTNLRFHVHFLAQTFDTRIIGYGGLEVAEATGGVSDAGMLPSPSNHHPSLSFQLPTMYPRNQRLPQRPAVLQPDESTFTPSKNTRKQYNNPTSSNMRTYDHAGRTN
ncbi:hypothetical protein TNCV_628581 [Trichonephila clavipes]|nr:hypothetical protein TNCV_628581 [Trichonephila clavipes]